MNMIFRILTAVLSALPVFSIASGTTIPEDSSWIVQLDLAELRETELGRLLVEEVIVPAFEDSQEGEPAGGFQLDIAAAVQLATSITAYGPRFNFEPGGGDPSGVLLLEGQPQLAAMLTGYVSYQTLNGGGELLQEEPFPVFQLEDGTVIATLSESRVAMSRSARAIKRLDALGTTANPGMDASVLLGRFSGLRGDGLFVAAIEGLNQLSSLPPQARVLKLTEGLAVRLDEAEGQLRADAVLRTRSATHARLVGQVLQGLIAMGTIVQEDPIGASELIRSLNVVNDEQEVQLSASLPAERILELLRAGLVQNHEWQGASAGQ